MLVKATNCYSSNDQLNQWASYLKKNHITGMQLNKKASEIKVKLFKLSFNDLIYVLCTVHTGYMHGCERQTVTRRTEKILHGITGEFKTAEH